MAKAKARGVTRTANKCVVGVVLGSDSDLAAMQRCVDLLAELGIGHEVRIISAHRTPDLADQYACSAERRGLKVLIAAAGMSAALSGVLAARTTLPVVGVPMSSGPLAGVDAALSTMQMPPGVPVACMAIGPAGATNAAIFAAQILAVRDSRLAARLKQYRAGQAQKVVEKDAALRGK
jgi:phosphoribosylaminoimidazole carboxylase PurE protein